MTLLLTLYPLRYPQVPHSRSVSVIDDFVKRTTITEVKSEINLRANIFGASDKSDALQDDWLKNDHPLGITLPSSYAVDLHCDDWDEIFTNLTR